MGLGSNVRLGGNVRLGRHCEAVLKQWEAMWEKPWSRGVQQGGVCMGWMTVASCFLMDCGVGIAPFRGMDWHIMAAAPRESPAA